MSTNFSPVETDVPRLRFQFRSSCKLLLNLLRDTEISLPFTPEPPLTPVSNLTQGFRNVGALAGDTPRRRLDLSNLSNGEEETAFNFSQSPRALEAGQKDSTEPQDNLCQNGCKTSVRGPGPSAAPLGFICRKYFSLLAFQTEVLCSTPGTPGCIHRINWEINSPSMNKENEGSFFKYPGWQVPRSLLFWKRPPDSQLTRYAAALERGSLEEYEMKDLGSPIAAGATQRMPEALDGFPELCPEELEETEKPLAGHLSSMAVLLSGPLLSQDINVSEVSMNKNRLFRSPSLPEKLNRPVLKQTVKNHGDETLMKVKQKHSPIQEQPDGVFALPTVMGRHQDLRYITSQTGALNIHRQDDLFEHFLRKPLLPSAPQKRLVLIFHCEFSSERGPKMCRYLREEDRAMNEYPALHYPELYVLQGGYKDFFLEYKEMCEPHSYCPMHHQDFKAEMLKFRVKSKTRAGEWKRRDQIAHLMKL